MRKLLMGLASGLGLLGFSLSGYADTTVQVWECNLEEGKTRDQLETVSAAWTRAAKKQPGGSEIQVFLEYPLVAAGGAGSFNFVMTIPDSVSWGTFNHNYGGSAAEAADEAWEEVASCSENSLFSSIEIE